jgi:hypothetical protein
MVVIGNGKTARSNVDAILSDFVESVDVADLVLVYDQKPSDGAVWAKQFAEEKLGSVTGFADNNYTALLSAFPKEDLKFFILWDDEDPECQLAASFAQANAIPAFDLTDGLMMISLKQSKIEAPVVSVIPIAEEVAQAVIADPVEPVKAPEPVVEDEEEDEEVLDLPSEEYDVSELVTLLVEQAGKELARSFFDEFKRLLNEQ